MRERVVPVPGTWQWEPNVPTAVLISNDSADVVLALRCHPNDEDRRTVVLRWHGAIATPTWAAPNDEALHTHRLYGVGLRDLLWLGEVEGSTWLADAVYDRARFRHFIAPLKERVVKVLAERITTTRSDMPRADAAFSTLTGNAPTVGH